MLIEGDEPLEDSYNQEPPVINRGDYLILPGKSHGHYSYPDLLVCKYKLADSKEVYNATRAIGGDLIKNSASGIYSGVYIGNLEWERALKLNLSVSPGNFTLNPRQHVDFRRLLQGGIDGSQNVYNGNGITAGQVELKRIWSEMAEQRDPFRGEYLDAYFEEKEGVLIINYDHRLIDKTSEIDYGFEVTSKEFLPQRSEQLEDCLMEDSYAYLSFNSQGFPTIKDHLSKKYSFRTNIGYIYPRKRKIARFGVDSKLAGLRCDSDPSFKQNTVGIRPARARD